MYAQIGRVKIQYARLDENSGKTYIALFTCHKRFMQWLNDPKNDNCLVLQVLFRYSYDKYTMEK